jgi:hypothetical protein
MVFLPLHQLPVQWHDPMACGLGAHQRKPLRKHPQIHGKPMEQIRKMTWGCRILCKDLGKML